MKEKIEYGREILLDEQKILQMDVLTAIDEFCRDNNIKYSMACGTMLGAVRHKGYIPWDDDIDIYLLREDYDKLMVQFPLQYKGHIQVLSLERSKKWDKPYGKAFDNRTIVVENADYGERYGINIDIFPVDEVPDEEAEWKSYDTRRRALYQKYAKRMAVLSFSLNPGIFARWVYYGLLKTFVSRRKMALKMDAYCKKWRNKGFSRVFECCQGIFQKKPFKKEVFNQLVDYPFEDRHFLGFENYDEYLRNGFGDYMTLPPFEKRITHHSYKSYWKK